MRQLKERELKTLHHLILGKSELEIGILLERSEKTINDYRRHLMRYFEAENMLDLTRKAFIYGFCDSILADTSVLSEGHSFVPFVIDDLETITLLHEILRGYTLQELSVKYNLNLDIVKKHYASICQHLDINMEEDLFTHSLASGYIRLVSFELQDFDKKSISAFLDEWREGKSALRLPKYKIEFEYFIRG